MNSAITRALASAPAAAAAVEAAAAEQVAREMADISFEPVLVLGRDLKVRAANQAFGRTFDLAVEQLAGRLVYQLDGNAWDNPELRELLRGACQDGKVEGVRLKQNFPRIGTRSVVINARCNEGGTQQASLILLAFREDAGEQRAN
jgi:two-component system, chemotaxis family, CheB/CheR fusion protein